MHGSITDGRPLTFGISEYGTRAADRVDVWYLHFVQDYSTLPTVFLGSSLDEPLFWQYVKLRGEQRPREKHLRRPKCFLVAKEISVPNEEVLRKYHIVAIRGTAEEFFLWPGNQAVATSREQVLRLIDPTLEIALAAAEQGKPQPEVKLAEYFYSFFKVPHRQPSPRARPGFLLGTPPTWEDIAAHVDAHREINELLKGQLRAAFNQDEPAMFILTSAAGGGKSTVAKRVAMELVDEGFSVVFSEGDQRPNPDAIASFARGFHQRMLFVFDNAGQNLHLIAQICELLKAEPIKHIFLILTRSNDMANWGYELARVSSLARIAVPHLSDADILSIIDTLAQHDALGKLRGKSSDEQFDVFKRKARKQILVAMREATSGLGFDEILKDEYAKLEPPEARLLYLIVALASSRDYGLTHQQMITAMALPPNETLLLAESSLFEILVPKETQPDRYVIRHPAIAEFILVAAPRDALAEAVVSFLRGVSTVLPEGRERRWSLAFKIYRDVINHRRLFQCFHERVEIIRDIYERVKPYYRDDGHYWLQFGSYELEYGDALDAAENYINQASALLSSQNTQVDTATARLMLRKALVAPNGLVAEELLENGLRTLRAQMSESGRASVHPFHIFGSQMMAYIGRWVPSRDRSEAFRLVHDELKRSIPEHLRAHPDLRSLVDSLKRVELETVLRGP